MSLLRNQQKQPTNTKIQYKPTKNVASAASANELIAELNDQIAQLEDQEREAQNSEDDGKLILDSACHPSNVPYSDSPLVPLSSPTTTLTANNSTCASTHKTTIKVNEHLSIPALVTPALTRKLLSVHDVALKAGPVIFTHNRAYILRRNRIAATATWKHPFYKIDTEQPAPAYITKTNKKSPTKPPPHARILPISKRNTHRIRTLVLPPQRPGIPRPTPDATPSPSLILKRKPSPPTSQRNHTEQHNRWNRRRSLLQPNDQAKRARTTTPSDEQTGRLSPAVNTHQSDDSLFPLPPPLPPSPNVVANESNPGTPPLHHPSLPPAQY